LRGKCRDCGAKISFRYPLVEFLSGALFVAVVYVFPLPLEVGFYLIFSVLLIVIFFIDLEHQVIPDSLSVSGVLFGLAFNFFRGLPYFFSALLGAGLGYFIFFLIARLGHIIFRKEAMGEGDLFLAAFLGAYLGWEHLFLAIFLAYLGAGLVALFLLAARKVRMGQAVPFGPALAAAGLAALFFGERIINWYLGFFS
jgi:leader peptidase (prepilin peptidase)/N-methyltransferase